MLTVTQVVAPSPAQAVDPVVIITTPPTLDGGGGPTLTVTDLGNGSIAVDNPGSTSPTVQQCTTVSEAAGEYCLGTSDLLVAPGSVPVGPVEVQGEPASPFRLPGEAMDWIVDEAVAAVAGTRGIESDELVRAYARPDIRGYIVARLMQILNKALYGEPLTGPEKAAYEELRSIHEDQLVKKAKWALEEYNLWTQNPCGYIPPPPPASKLPVIKNDALDSTLCTSAGARFSLWQVTKGTPSTDTFDTWAAYRHPTPDLKALDDPDYAKAFAATYGGAFMLAGYVGAAGVAAVLGLVLSGLGESAVSAIAAAIPLWTTTTIHSTVTTASAFTLAVGGASSIFAIVACIITLGIAIWQMVEDAKPGDELRRRVTDSANDDALDIAKDAPDYAGLDLDSLEDPADPAKKALIHTDGFVNQLIGMVNSWQLFTPSGEFVADPTTGYNPQGTTTDSDVHFVVDGLPRDFVTVAAPPGTQNALGQPVSGYRVTVSRGIPMVSELVSGGDFGPYEPRTRVFYIDADGNLGQMALMQIGQADGPPIRQFQLAVQDDQGDTTSTASPSWTFSAGAAGLKTATLIEQLPVTPPVNVIPSVQGDLVADHVLHLEANLSTPGASKGGGHYAWAIERLDAAGNVVETINPGDNLVAFNRRFTVPGDYRAKVTYSWTTPEVGSASGRVQFSVDRPAAQVSDSNLTGEPEIQDDRVDTGAISLDLRIRQNTRGDDAPDPDDAPEFDVTVDWADDSLGNTVTGHYSVRCADAGADTCDTGPLLAPPGGGAPTNDNWSEPPTFLIPDEQNFLPHVTVTITNSYGETIRRVFEVTGEHRPKYASMHPFAAMPAGTGSIVDVVRVFPSDLFDPPDVPGVELLQIQPFVNGIVDQLPRGVVPQIVEKGNGEWWLQLNGKPAADAIGAYTFYFPFEQNVADGNPRRPAPALATLEVVSSTDPGYRGILRGATFDIETYRNGYPDYLVQAAQVLVPGEDEFSDFTGTVMCKLVDGPQVLFDKPCAANQPFPWPSGPLNGLVRASVYLESDTQPISADGPYEAPFVVSFLDPLVTVDPVGPTDASVRVKLRVDDGASFVGVVPPPFSTSGYTVTCSLDGAAFVPCLDDGQDDFARTPGGHSLRVKVMAPDAATTTRTVTWAGWPLLSASVTGRPTTATAHQAHFDLAVGYEAAVAAPYAAKGFTVSCSADGGKHVACFDDGTLTLLRVPGRHELSVTVKAPGPDTQTVTTEHVWKVATPKTTLTVRAPSAALAGERITVRAVGLLPRERYVVKLAGDRVAKGHANDHGKLAVGVRVPGKTSVGPLKVVVRGATDKRTGKDVVHVADAIHARADDLRLGPILV